MLWRTVNKFDFDWQVIKTIPWFHDLSILGQMLGWVWPASRLCIDGVLFRTTFRWNTLLYEQRNVMCYVNLLCIVYLKMVSFLCVSCDFSYYIWFMDFTTFQPLWTARHGVPELITPIKLIMSMIGLFLKVLPLSRWY